MNYICSPPFRNYNGFEPQCMHNHKLNIHTEVISPVIIVLLATPSLLTVVHFACNGGHFEVAKLLVEHGASLTAEDNVSAEGDRTAVSLGWK